MVSKYGVSFGVRLMPEISLNSCSTSAFSRKLQRTSAFVLAPFLPTSFASGTAKVAI